MPDYIYKYTRREFAEKMVEYGQIRIGTLYDYWNEWHCEGVRDSEEGKILRYNIIEYRDGDPPPPQWGTEFFSFGRLPGCVIRNAMAQKEWGNTIPDTYIYCGVLEFNARLFNEFHSQYDTCVRIGPIEEFMGAIYESLGGRKKIYSTLSGRCNYGERELTYDRGKINTHPALLKKEEYRPQSEYRLVFETQLRGIRPKILTLKNQQHLFTLHAAI